MKTTIKLLAVFALMLAVLSPVPVGAAAEVFKYKGQGVEFSYASMNGSECVYTDVWVFAGEEFSHNPPGKGSEWSGVLVSMYQYDFCTSTYLLGADGNARLAKSSLKISGDLSSATLTAIVNVHDYISDTDYDVFIDLSMTATSDLVREKLHEKWGFDDCFFNVHQKSDSRTARTTGTVTNGSINFTPEPSEDDAIFSAMHGDIFHSCK